MNKIEINKPDTFNIKPPPYKKTTGSPSSGKAHNGLPVPKDEIHISPNKNRKKDIITILHTNDLHGHALPHENKDVSKTAEVGGLAYIGKTVDLMRKQNPGGIILLDAGDITSGAPISDVFNEKPMTDAMNKLGYDAMVVGNHEMDGTGRKNLEGIIKNTDFPLLSANMVDLTNGKKPLNIKPYIIKEVKGIKVGIMGLTTRELMATMKEEDRKELQLSDVQHTARKTLQQMKKEGAELFVALTHQGVEEDIKLAGKVRGIDVIIGGHSHTELLEPLKIGHTLIAQAGKFGGKLGILDKELLISYIEDKKSVSAQNDGRIRLEDAGKPPA